MSRRGDAGTAQETASWKKLRGAKCPGKIKHFLWRVETIS